MIFSVLLVLVFICFYKCIHKCSMMIHSLCIVQSRRLTVALSLVLLLCLSGCLPKPPAYPFREKDTLRAEAQGISDRLDRYVNLWLDGKVPAELPDSVIPGGIDRVRFPKLVLVHPDSIAPEQQWGVRPAKPIDPAALVGFFPDPNATYLVIFNAFLPFGHRAVIEGEYPYARFMSAQFTPPFGGTAYRYGNYGGVGEVGYLDADIPPKKGHRNPFRQGVSRQVENRSYRIVFESAIGFSHELNNGYRPPDYRVTDSICYGSGIQCHGPWGEDSKFGHGRGIWDMGEIWLRYYAIDHGRGPLGGVDLPRVRYETSDGRAYFIACDLNVIEQQSNPTAKLRSFKGNKGPDYRLHGPYIGWNKQFDIFMIIAEGLGLALDKTEPNHKAYIRDLQLGVTGRGEKQAAPDYFEPHATGCLYAKYLVTGMRVGKEHVFVLTGKLPSFPDTRSGAPFLDSAQCRYWSIIGYDSEFPFAEIPGLAVSSVMDDEVITDENGHYIIVFSSEDDRPENATAENGVTWVNARTAGTQTLTLRWFDIGGEWTMPLAPNEVNLPWHKAGFTASEYDPWLTGVNSHNGLMKDYLPKRHYLSKADFEALGNKRLNYLQVPEWTYGN